MDKTELHLIIWGWYANSKSNGEVWSLVLTQMIRKVIILHIPPPTILISLKKSVFRSSMCIKLG